LDAVEYLIERLDASGVRIGETSVDGAVERG
jgi:hypothetical protein